MTMVALVLPFASMTAETTRLDFHLPSDVAEKSLKLFSTQSGRGLIADTVVVKGARTNGVQGTFTAREALERMLAGTGLVSAQDTRTGSFSVRRQPATKPREDHVIPAAGRDARAEQALPRSERSYAAPPADLPEGLELVMVAAPPLVNHPMMGCIDDRGRLYVGDAVGVNLDKAGLEARLPNRVLLLEDVDGDGVFDKSTVFADKMTFPSGAVWLDGSLYVASPPGIWKLTDADNDGVAEKREMIVGGFDYTGNAADVHGPFLHPNGRLIWTHGLKGHRVVQPDGTLVHEGRASGIWSANPDGSDIQWISLASMGNPVALDFAPEGEIVGTANVYYLNPRGDTLVHWLYGGVYERASNLKDIAGLSRTLKNLPGPKEGVMCEHSTGSPQKVLVSIHLTISIEAIIWFG